MPRNYSLFDRVILRAQETASGAANAPAPRPNPAANVPAPELSETERRHAAGLMRVNHAGEIAAQALYRGQALVARDADTRRQLDAAADEEQSHLRWCHQRLSELEALPSRLDPLWYAGSFALGALAGLAGDRWSLGFVEETERQVSEHLDGHLDQLPESDVRSRRIVETMKAEEERHGQDAVAAGARPLPAPVRDWMRRAARVMTSSAYWI